MNVAVQVGTLADFNSLLLKLLLWLSDNVIYPKYSQTICVTSVTVFVSSLLLYNSILDATTNFDSMQNYLADLLTY